jgi:hypothetical protein
MPQLTAEELRQAEILADPVQWSWIYLNWKARNYQEDILRDDYYRQVWRLGRRTGKTETIVIKSLHKAYTNKRFRIIIVTPYENQIRLFWNRFEELIEDCPELKESVKITHNPYVVKFKNGSSIKGFTAGTKAGSGGAGVRGQGADWIFLDEADYLLHDDIVAVTAIALEAPERIHIFVSSTPTGRRDFFWKVCTDPRSAYREYHFSSHENPEWTDKADEEFRIFHSELDYQHEVLAEFGDEAAGVFKKEYLERASSQLQYAYQDLNYFQQEHVKANDIRYLRLGPYDKVYKPPSGPIRTMGVDWDKVQATPQIVISEFVEPLGKFQVVYHEDILQSQFTLDNAVKAIIDLNDIYHPHWIYVDRGMGEYQVEMLHAYGIQHPESGLETKVKGWMFNQNVDVIDPATHELAQKPLKHFMVNNGVWLFERDRILISAFDEMLYYQLQNYSVVRKSVSGAPIYTSKNEHALDAMMLSLAAFAIEFPEITQTIRNPDNTEHVLRVPPPAKETAKAVFANMSGRSGSTPSDSHQHPYQLGLNIGSASSWRPRGSNPTPYRRRLSF